jgi:hypothetical protein
VSSIVSKQSPVELVRSVHYLLRPLGRFLNRFDIT